MSVRVMTAVFEHSQSTGNDRLVLLAIADEANDDGTNAYPGQTRISSKARVPLRTVQRCIERLIALGELQQERPLRQGRGQLTHYTVLVGKDDTMTPFAPDDTQEGCQKGAEGGQKGDTPPPLTCEDVEYSVPSTQYSKDLSHPEPPTLSLVMDSVSPTATADGFEDFWQRYPRRNGKREGKRKAHEVWARLKPAQRQAAMVGVGNYAQVCDAGQLAADAFRWLREGRWEDWQDPPDTRPADVPADAVLLDGTWVY